MENYISQGFHFGDSISLIKKVETNSIHQILSDIPYGISFDSWDVLHDNKNSALNGKSPAQKDKKIFKTRGKPINGWSDADKNIGKEYQNWCSSWASDWLRVLKPGGSVFVFAGRRMAARCIVALEDAGFNFRDMLGWQKTKAPYRAQKANIVFERRNDIEMAEKWKDWRLGNLAPIFEPILWFQKPYKITITDNILENEVGAFNQEAFSKYFGLQNSFSCGFEKNELGHHPTQKPTKLMKALIELSTIENQIVLDPFAGSATTLVAAKELNRKYIGFENNEEFFKNGQERLI